VGPVEITPRVTAELEVPVVPRRRPREEQRAVATVEPEESFKSSGPAVPAVPAVPRLHRVAVRRRRQSAVMVALVATPLGVATPEPVERAEVP